MIAFIYCTGVYFGGCGLGDAGLHLVLWGGAAGAGAIAAVVRCSNHGRCGAAIRIAQASSGSLVFFFFSSWHWGLGSGGNGDVQSHVVPYAISPTINRKS